MNVIRVEQKEEWNKCIKSFKNWDVYYLNEYAKSLELHGDGIPILIYFASDNSRMAYIMMENDIADVSYFVNYIKKGKYIDWTTPYGYGGPLYAGEITENWIKSCWDELKTYAHKNNIISQFFRFHPLTQNQIGLENVLHVIYEKKTVYIDTSSENLIYTNMTPNNRNMVRKAKRLGVKIIWDYGERMEKFEKIYKRTMEMHHADNYYNFSERYFSYIREEMKDYTVFFYVQYNNEIISSSIFFYNKNYMHYHLSGTLPEYRNLGAANLLLTEAAYWACERGIPKLHLGGGVEKVDSLLRFKKHFNRNGEIDFCIGCNIFDENKFRDLVMLRKQQDASFDENQKYMILYRA